MSIRFRTLAAVIAVFTILVFAGCSTVSRTGGGDFKGKDPYADYVWPQPPDAARIKLEAILSGRLDVETSSKWQAALFGSQPGSGYDYLRKPYGADFDPQGRLLVTDSALGAVFRFDRAGRKLDVFGTTGASRLKSPLGITVAGDGTIYVADIGLDRVFAFDGDGKLKGAFGKTGELENPTDMVLSPDGTRLFVVDSKAHQVVVFDRATAARVGAFGKRGDKEGEFNFPTSIACTADGHLLVVDQMNARVQVFNLDGEFIDQFGRRGVGFGDFVRPKDVAVDSEGFIYVSDAAFNNIQIFDADLRLLIFVGEGGAGPGQFQIASGVAVHGDLFAVVDQLGRRVEIFRFLLPKSAE